MEELKKSLMLLTSDQKAHVRAIIGEGPCVRTPTGISFDLHNLPPRDIENIKEYISASKNQSSRNTPALRLEVAPDLAPVVKKKPIMTKHQTIVKKRLKAKCRQRKPLKQDKASNTIDMGVASEFCDAVKNEDDDVVCMEDFYENTDDFSTMNKDDALEIDDELDEPEEKPDLEPEDLTILPPVHVGMFEHYITFLKAKGFPC